MKALIVASLMLAMAVTSVPASSATPKSPFPQGTQLGMDTYFVYNCQSQTLIDKWATTQVDAFKYLGANAIGIGFPLYTTTITSNDVFAKLQCNPNGSTSPYQTPPPSVIADVIRIAHAAGLQVLLRPLLDQQNLYTQDPKWWRGVLEPTDPSLWIENYLSTLRPYLLMAQQMHVEHVAIETELASLLKQSFWGPAVALVRAIYKGDVVFNYPWQYTYGRKVIPAGTSLGLDTYPKTKAGPNSTSKQILAQWNHLLRLNKQYSVPKLSKAVIDEIGITAQFGAYLQPEAVLPDAGHAFNEWIQAKWFEAACQFARQHQLQGIYYWGAWLTTFAGAIPKVPYEKNPSYIQPGGARAIKKCFTTTG